MTIKVNLVNQTALYDIDLEIIDADTRQMGTERIWGGSIDVNINGTEEEIALEISEYPDGAFNSIVDKSKYITTSDDNIADQFRSELHK